MLSPLAFSKIFASRIRSGVFVGTAHVLVSAWSGSSHHKSSSSSVSLDSGWLPILLVRARPLSHVWRKPSKSFGFGIRCPLRST